MKTQKEYLQRARASVGPKKRRSATRARPQFALGSVFLADCPGDFRSQGSFLRLWQIDAVLSEFRRPLGEPAPALGSFFRRGGGTQRAKYRAASLTSRQCCGFSAEGVTMTF